MERMDTSSTNKQSNENNNGITGNTGTSSGSLRAKISLKGGYSQLAMVSPFYGMKELPRKFFMNLLKIILANSPLLGSNDMINICELSGPYNRYCGPKKLPENLSSFLHQICGTSNLNYRNDASCSLRRLVEKPPITGKEIVPLSASAMVGFKLAPGKVPENYQLFDLSDSNFNQAMASTSIGPNSYNSNATNETNNGASTSTNGGPAYNEYVRNFNDPEEEKNKHRKKFKRTMDDLEGESERKIKKHKGDEREKDKVKKEKKKEKKEKKEKKKKKNMEEDSKKRKEVVSPFY